jgi:arsenate reductase
MSGKSKILFLCTGNSCRSQMAEAWTRQLMDHQFELYSAGAKPRDIDPRAVKAMAEVGIDISAQVSKEIETLGDLDFDYVVTLCDNARESCPYFPAKTRVMHWGFDDPPTLAADAEDEEEAMAPYRRVLDEIKAFVENLPEALGDKKQNRDSR